MKRWALWLLALPLAAAPLACSPPRVVLPVTPPTPGEVRIGAIYPLTGSLRAAGWSCWDGIRLAVEIVNGDYPDLDLPLARGKGLPNLGGVPVRVLLVDSADILDRSWHEAQRLATREKVSALIGCYSTDATATASLGAEEVHVPFLCDIAGAPGLTRRGMRWFFRTAPDDGMLAAQAFDFLQAMRDSRGARIEAVATAYAATAFGADLCHSQNEEAARRGFRMAANVPYPANARALGGEAQALKWANPDVLLANSHTADAVGLVRACRAMGLRPQAILLQESAPVEDASLQALGRDGEGLLGARTFALDLAQRRPVIGQVNELFRQRYGRDMDAMAARACMGLLVLAEAIDRAGSREPEAVRQALLATAIPARQVILPWEGVRFDASGQNVLGRGVIAQVQDGRYWTVWPWALASREVVWPLPGWEKR